MQIARLVWYNCSLACRVCIAIRVESGLDDPDNLGHLGHFFGGSSGSHPQTKLSGYHMFFRKQCWHLVSGSDECTEISLIGVTPAYIIMIKLF